MFECSSDYRAAARVLLRGRWQNAMIVTFFSTVLNLAMSVVMTYISPVFYEQLMSFAYLEISQVELVKNVLSSCLLPLEIMAALVLLELLAGEALELGRIHFFENIVQGKPASFRDLFSRFPIFFKAVGLRLWMVLKIAVWALPGLILYVGITFLLSKRIVADSADLNYLLSLIMLMELVGAAAMFVPAVIAYFRFCMAPYIMAQIPSAGIRACVSRSKQLMNGKKKSYFFVILGFAGWLLLEEILSSVLSGISYPVSIVVCLFFSLAVSVYMEMTKVLFYAKLTDQLGMHRQSAPEDSESDNEGEE